MKKQCLNHGCTKEWETFGVGDLYSLEIHTRKDHLHHTKFFWLCPDCAKRFDIYLEEPGIVRIRPRSLVAIGRIPSPEFDLRLVMHGISNYRTSTDRESVIKPHPIDVKEQSMIVPLLSRITTLCNRFEGIDRSN